jgi:hypothetical protein
MLSELRANNRSDMFSSTVSFDMDIGSKTAHLVAQYIVDESGCEERNWPYFNQLTILRVLSEEHELTKVTSASP